MKIKISTSILILIFMNYSCSDKEYNVDEFFKVQGIIVSAKKTSSPFDSSQMKEIIYEYFVNDSTILTNSEKFIFVDMFKGVPIEVLVYKENQNKSFYWRNGLSENITEFQYKYVKDKALEIIK